jgi:hypothetical protein
MTSVDRYDIAVAYRVYPGLSSVAEPFGLEKEQLARACLRSFRESLGPLRARIWAILDGCPPVFGDMFRETFPAQDLTVEELEGAGNVGTFERQLDLLTGQNDSAFVFLAEDDYLFRPNAFPALLEFLSTFPDADFVTPYDHPDYYRLGLTRPRCRVRVSGNCHWRTAGTTCLTFLTRRETLQATRGLFETYRRGNYDSSIWLSLTRHRVLNPMAMLSLARKSRTLRVALGKAWIFGWRQILFGKKRSLWAPMPSVATHLDEQGLASGYEWDSLLGRQ